MHIYEVKARFWEDDKIVESLLLFTGNSYADVADKIEEYFSDDLCGCSITELETPLMIDVEVLAEWRAQCDSCKKGEV